MLGNRLNTPYGNMRCQVVCIPFPWKRIFLDTLVGGELESHPSPLFLAFAFRSLHGRVLVWLLVISSDCHEQSLTIYSPRHNTLTVKPWEVGPCCSPTLQIRKSRQSWSNESKPQRLGTLGPKKHSPGESSLGTSPRLSMERELDFPSGQRAEVLSSASQASGQTCAFDWPDLWGWGEDLRPTGALGS